MAPKPQPKRPADTSTENPDYNPFLKPADLKGGTAFHLTGWNRRGTGKFGPQIICEVEQDATQKTFDFAMKEGSPNHRELFKRGGGDYLTWKGPIELGTKDGKFGEFVSIERIPF